MGWVRDNSFTQTRNYYYFNSNNQGCGADQLVNFHRRFTDSFAFDPNPSARYLHRTLGLLWEVGVRDGRSISSGVGFRRVNA